MNGILESRHSVLESTTSMTPPGIDRISMDMEVEACGGNEDPDILRVSDKMLENKRNYAQCRLMRSRQLVVLLHRGPNETIGERMQYNCDGTH